MSIEWLLALDIKYFLLTIILMGAGFSLFVIFRLKKIDKERLADLEKQSEMNKLFWAELKEAIRLYNQVDKLESNNSLAIRFLSDPLAAIVTMKQSADGKGDHALNRDV